VLGPSLRVRPWLRLSFAFAVALLAATWIVATRRSPDPAGLLFPGVNETATAPEALSILGRNLLVLALHAMACVGGYLAAIVVPREAVRHSGLRRRAYERAGGLAMALVCLATAFSLVTQATVLGGGAATLAAQLGVSPAVLLVGLLPHALPELTVLFLPLAVWLVAWRRRAWQGLVGSLLASVCVAVPALAICALVEVYVSPHLLLALARG
jgi:hypothetical protein